MCGLMFTEEVEQWPSLVTSNLARAGRNKGAMTFTAWVAGLTAMEMFDTTRTVDGGDLAFPKPGIVHLQAPTSEASRPHPATANDTLVWHNGLFQPLAIEVMKKTVGSYSNWDTKLLAEAVALGFESMEFHQLSGVEASFAAIAFRAGSLYAFRNAIAPLYTNPKTTTLSSTPVGETNVMMPAGVVFVLTREQGWVPTTTTFDVSYNPYGL